METSQQTTTTEPGTPRENSAGQLQPAAPEFDRFAADYRKLHDANISITGETGEYFAAYKANYLKTRVAPAETRKVLDFGCGVGMLSDVLKRCFPDARIDGYDLSDESLKQVSPELRAQGVFSSRLSDLSDGDYDLAVIANVLHHVPPTERATAISNAVGMLRPGGGLAVFEHNPANPLTRRAIETCPFDEDAILLPPRETLGYFNGLEGVRRRYVVFFPRALRWFRPLEGVLGWCPLGAQYVVSGRKPQRSRS